MAAAVDAAEDFGRALAVLLRSYREQVGPVVSDFPQRARGYQTLAEVVRGGQPSQLALAKHLGIDRTVMTYLIDDLVEAGLVERRENPSDRRQRLVVATARGRTAVATLCDRVTEAENRVLEALDGNEREALRRLVSKAACGTAGDASAVDACEVLPDDDLADQRPSRRRPATRRAPRR